MKRVSTLEYLQKKNIVEDLKNGKYTSTVLISDEEFERINNKLDEYYMDVKEFQSSTLTPEQQSIFNEKLQALEQAIEELKQVAYDEVNIDNGIMDITNIK